MVAMIGRRLRRDLPVTKKVNGFVSRGTFCSTIEK